MPAATGTNTMGSEKAKFPTVLGRKSLSTVKGTSSATA
jgi:hypothetical protein